MGRGKNLAVVMPAGENAFYIDQPEMGTMHGKFIGEELVDITRRMFPLSRKREDTYIGGLSMGGFGALRNGLKYHDTFWRNYKSFRCASHSGKSGGDPGGQYRL